MTFDGQPVRSQRQLLFLVAESAVGAPLPCKVERDGQLQTLEVILTELDPARLDGEATKNWLGLVVGDLAGTDPRVTRLVESYGINAASGVIVVAAEPVRPGAEAGIRAGDVLVAIEGRDLPDMTAWRASADALRGQRDALNVLVRTGTNERYVEVTPRDEGSLQ